MGVVKKLGVISMASTLMLSLAACGGAGGSKSTEAPAKATNEPSAKKVEITYAHGKDATDGTKKLIEAFEKSHPNIKVNFRELPNDTGTQHDQYVTMFNTQSSEIDVFDLDVVWPAEFIQAGYLLPLDDLIEKNSVNTKDFIEGAYNAANYNGKQWALPRFVDAGLLFYRKDIVSKPPATWEELIAQAKANNGKEGTKYGYLMQAKQYEGLVCNAIEFISAYGGQVVDGKGAITINSTGTIKGLEVMKEILGSDFVPKDILTYMETETDNGFTSGSSVFVRNWPYQFAQGQDASKSKIVDKVGIAPLPKGDVRSAATLGGWMSGINKNSKHKQEAFEFLKFITGPEGAKVSALVGGAAPTVKSLYNDADIKAKNPIFADPGFVAGISAAVPRPVSPVYPKLSDIMQTEITKFLYGKQTAKEAVAVMETQMKAAVQK